MGVNNGRANKFKTTPLQVFAKGVRDVSARRIVTELLALIQQRLAIDELPLITGKAAKLLLYL